MVLDPLGKATEVLDKVEALAENIDDYSQKAGVLLEVANKHIEIGRQLLVDFER